MNLTPEQLDKYTALNIHAHNYGEGARKVIEAYLDDHPPGTQWVPVTERLPTREDADADGNIQWAGISSDPLCVSYASYHEHGGSSHWMPAPKSPLLNDPLRAEFTALLPEGKHTPQEREMMFQGYKLAKQP